MKISWHQRICVGLGANVYIIKIQRTRFFCFLLNFRFSVSFYQILLCNWIVPYALYIIVITMVWRMRLLCSMTSSYNLLLNKIVGQRLKNWWHVCFSQIIIFHCKVLLPKRLTTSFVASNPSFHSLFKIQRNFYQETFKCSSKNLASHSTGPSTIIFQFPGFMKLIFSIFLLFILIT